MHASPSAAEIEQALAHQKAGRLSDAEAVYRHILEREPEQPDALHWLGVIALQRGQPETAAALIGRAVTHKPENVEAHSNLALALQAQGRLAEAVEVYGRALALAPNDPDIYINLGLALRAQGQPEQAAKLFCQALALGPGFASLCMVAELLVQQGKLAEAIDAYRQALAVQPGAGEIHNKLGIVLERLGDLTAAKTAYDKATERDPDLADAHYNRGRALQAQGRLAEAVDAYRRALECRPHFAEAHNNLGTALVARGEFTDAIAAYRRSLAAKPDYADAHNNLGLALYASGKSVEAETAFRASLAGAANDADVYNNLGMALAAQGKAREAVGAFRQALALDSTFAAAHNNLGNVHTSQADADAAIAAYEQALALKPDYAEAYSNLGNVLAEEGRLTDAISAYDKALALTPSFAQAHSNRAVALLRQGQYEAAIAGFRQAFTLDPDYAEAHSNLVQARHYEPGLASEALCAEARGWQQRYCAPLACGWRPHENDPDPARPLRLGYVSADFRRHPVGWFMAPVFAHHNKTEFELFCYAGVRRFDDMTAHFQRRAHTWREVLALSDATLAEQIRVDQIDILIDLSGHTRGHRLLAFARRPAPVQLTAGGHYDTTGLEAIDYLIADRFHAPAGAERYFSEELIRLPHDYICYGPPEYAPAVAPPPLHRRGHLTFGCYNNLAKLNAQVIALWARILQALPASRLRLQTRELNDAATGERVRARFAAAGIAPERLELCGAVAHAKLLAAYGEIDIALDPFPYSGGLTTCEALWMGVPVITLTGANFCGRHSTSHLANVGVTELIAASPTEYVELALALAENPERLSALRQGLRARMAASPLCDAAGYTRDLEAVYRGMWRKYCEARN